ncbi:hypothetical protein VP01_398g6 [Puccinia sorghi]|uniref:Uncharacterized protein n=1 Tax=Puccinia sorghi TaxID=27349 RepID=A0A0L6UU41_9BASI|nr:hypothetical protein VP01_398g6 [Puccinia sorghi]
MHQTQEDYWRQSHTCTTWKQWQALFEKSCCSCPLKTLRKFFQKIYRQHLAYELGLRGLEAQIAMKKYSSHFRIPRVALMDIHVMALGILYT